MTEMIEPPVLDTRTDPGLPGNGEGDAFDERKNTGRCVVAIPTATEPIHHVGDVSEPKHMTVLWLGKPEENPDLDMDAVQEAVRAKAEQSGLLTGTVDSQGPLGDEGAQVALLSGDQLSQFRDDLLADPVLREGAGSVEQHPDFTPHVTLGYNMDEPVPDEDLPQDVIFDRVGVWDGDEHTEYPLGPSASTEENTDGPEVQTEPGADQDILFAQKLNVSDAVSLASACAAVDQIADEVPRVFARRRLTKRARELGIQHVIPRDWLRRSAPTAAAVSEVSALPAQNANDVRDLFQLKTQLSTLPDTALRAAYVRGVREYAMTSPQSRPPLSRDAFAQARVNSLIRLAQGDLSARTDDRDLLP